MLIKQLQVLYLEGLQLNVIDRPPVRIDPLHFTVYKLKVVWTLPLKFLSLVQPFKETIQFAHVAGAVFCGERFLRPCIQGAISPKVVQLLAFRKTKP